MLHHTWLKHTFKSSSFRAEEVAHLLWCKDEDRSLNARPHVKSQAGLAVACGGSTPEVEMMGLEMLRLTKPAHSGPPHRHTLVAHTCTHTHVNTHTHAINVANYKGQSSMLKVGRSRYITSVNQLHQHGMNCILSLGDDTLRRTRAFL